MLLKLRSDVFYVRRECDIVIGCRVWLPLSTTMPQSHQTAATAIAASVVVDIIAVRNVDNNTSGGNL